MGLNMPARTVLFTSPRKFDGIEYRWINSGEYTQMSGRAGRRGKDESGTVILIIDEILKPDEAKAIVTGKSAPLNSAYKITYNMIFNLLRVDEINPEYLMEKSFCQYQNYHKIPDYYKNLEALKIEYDSIIIEREDEVESYYRLKKCINEIDKKMWNIIVKPIYIVQYLQIGRLIKVSYKDFDYGWGIVINLKKRSRNDKMEIDTHYIVDVLCNIPNNQIESTSNTVHGKDESNSDEPSVILLDDEESPQQIIQKTANIVPITLKCITGISAVRLFVPKELISCDSKRKLLDKIETIMQKLDGKLPDLDPINDIKISESKFIELNEQKKMFQGRLLEHNLNENREIAEFLCQKMKRKEEIKEKISVLTKDMHGCVSLIQMTELFDKKRVLRRLDYCTEDDMITLKGRVACEVTSSDELVLTEMLFDGVFNRLSPEKIAAILSCFVCEEKSKVIKELDKDLSTALRQLQDIARRIGRITFECGIISDVEDYVSSFKPHMMHIVYQWANGKNFSELCQSTDIFEGSIVRTMRRLEELIRQLINAAMTIESNELTEKFKKAIEKIKRDIVFANSLYF